MPRETSDNGMSVEGIYAQFLSSATPLVWPRRNRIYKLITKYHLAESFITSPPVHAEYWTFVNLTENAGMNIESEGQLRGCILSVLRRFQEVMFNKHRVFDIHRYLETSAGVSIRASLDLSDFVLKYLVSIELWRRREIWLGRDWAFEDDECTCSFLASTLLQLWNMDKEGCFEMQDKTASKSAWDILWEQWLDHYPRLDLGDDSEDAAFAHRQFGIRGELMLTQTGYIGGRWPMSSRVVAKVIRAASVRNLGQILTVCCEDQLKLQIR